MTRIRVFIVLVLAITAGGAFAFGTYNYVQNLPTQTTTIPTKPVVVAASDLDIGAELTRDNIRIIQWPANGGTNQQWRLVPVDSGYVKIVSVRSGKVIGAAGESTSDSAVTEQQTDTGSPSQQWILSHS